MDSLRLSGVVVGAISASEGKDLKVCRRDLILTDSNKNIGFNRLCNHYTANILQT